MKVALIDQTSLKDLPLAASLRRRGHHVVVISQKERAPFPSATAVTRCEYHHIGLDDIAQLVTALQDCAAAVICSGDFPCAEHGSPLDPAEEDNIREACRRAGVAQLTRLGFARTHTAPVLATKTPPHLRESHAA